jgi:hypothetical protein
MSDSGSIPKTNEIISLDPLHGLADNGAKAPALFLQQARASERLFDFFTSNIRNKHAERLLQRRLPVLGILHRTRRTRPAQRRGGARTSMRK